MNENVNWPYLSYGKLKIDEWGRDYDEFRSRNSINSKTPDKNWFNS